MFFGSLLDNGPDGAGDAHWLDRGERPALRLSGADGACEDLDVMPFTLRIDRALDDLGLDADHDGRLLREASGPRQNGFA